MNCQQFAQYLDEYADRRMGATEPSAAAHVHSCAECRSLSAAYDLFLSSRTWEATRPLPPAGWAERIIPTMTAPEQSRTRSAILAGMLTAAASVAVAVWVGWQWAQSSSRLAESRPAAPTRVPLIEPDAPTERSLHALAWDVTNRYQELATGTRSELWGAMRLVTPARFDARTLLGWDPSFRFPVDERAQSAQSDEWYDGMSNGWEPIATSTSMTLRSLLQAFPGAVLGRCE